MKSAEVVEERYGIQRADSKATFTWIAIPLFSKNKRISNYDFREKEVFKLVKVEKW